MLLLFVNDLLQPQVDEVLSGDYREDGTNGRIVGMPVQGMDEWVRATLGAAHGAWAGLELSSSCRLLLKAVGKAGLSTDIRPARRLRNCCREVCVSLAQLWREPSHPDFPTDGLFFFFFPGLKLDEPNHSLSV